MRNTDRREPRDEQDSGFEQHFFESDESGVINHNKIVQGPDTNREPLEELQRILEK